jgi:hypothetical protein
MFSLHTNLRALLLAAGTLALAACPEKENETDSSTGTAGEPTATESATSTDGTATEGTTTDTPTTGGTMGGTGTTTEGETAGNSESQTSIDIDTEGTTEGDSDSTTGGVIPPELEAACTAACEKFFECIPRAPFPDVESCTQDCVDSSGSGEMCVAASTAFNSCLGEMTCEQLETAFDTEVFGPCQDEFDVIEGGCQDQLCEGFAGGDGMGSCSIGQLCPDTPAQEFRCEGDTCTCLVDDQPQSECPAPAGFCELGVDEQNMAAFECCGFEF